MTTENRPEQSEVVENFTAEIVKLAERMREKYGLPARSSLTYCAPLSVLDQIDLPSLIDQHIRPRKPLDG